MTLTTFTAICTDLEGCAGPLIYTVDLPETADEAAITEAVRAIRAEEVDGFEPHDLEVHFAWRGDLPYDALVFDNRY